MTQGEERILQIIRMLCLPEPLYGEKELRFHPPDDWLFDFAWPEIRFAVEYNGHPSHMLRRYHTDRRKVNTAQILGWLVIEITPKMLERDEAALFIRQGYLRCVGESGALSMPTQRFLGNSTHTKTKPERKRNSTMGYKLDDYATGGTALKAATLKKYGYNNCTFTIRDFEPFTFKATDTKPEETKLTVGFEELEERLTLNKTNMTFLKTEFQTDDCDAMIGQKVNLVCGMTQNPQGGAVETILIVSAPKTVVPARPRPAPLAAAAAVPQAAPRARAAVPATAPADEVEDDPFADE